MSHPSDRRNSRGIAAAAAGANVLQAAKLKLPPFVSIASREDKERATSDTTQMALALGRRGVTYVRPPASVVAKRRAKGRAARRARKAARR